MPHRLSEQHCPKGREFFKKAVALAPENFEIKESLAALEAAAGENARAVAMLDQIIDKQPERSRARQLRRDAKWRFGEQKSALAD